MTTALFAEFTTNTIPIATFVLIGIVLLSFLMVVVNQFKRCPSNRVLVIYGKTLRQGQAARTIHGGAAFVVPLIQDYAYLSLEPIQIEVPLRGALSSENIRVNVPSVFTVAIDTKPEVMQNAAVRLLGLASQRNPQAGRGNHLRPTAAGDRVDGHRRDQPRPR